MTRTARDGPARRRPTSRQDILTRLEHCAWPLTSQQLTDQMKLKRTTAAMWTARLIKEGVLKRTRPHTYDLAGAPGDQTKLTARLRSLNLPASTQELRRQAPELTPLMLEQAVRTQHLKRLNAHTGHLRAHLYLHPDQDISDEQKRPYLTHWGRVIVDLAPLPWPLNLQELSGHWRVPAPRARHWIRKLLRQGELTNLSSTLYVRADHPFAQVRWPASERQLAQQTGQAMDRVRWHLTLGARHLIMINSEQYHLKPKAHPTAGREGGGRRRRFLGQPEPGWHPDPTHP